MYHHHPIHDEIGLEHFIWGRLSKEIIITMFTYYQTAKILQQRFTETGWAKTVIKFMLESRVNEWKYRCNLPFQVKNNHDNNEIISFHKRALLIIVEHFLIKSREPTGAKKSMVSWIYRGVYKNFHWTTYLVDNEFKDTI